MSKDGNGEGIPFENYAAIDLVGDVDDSNKV